MEFTVTQKQRLQELGFEGSFPSDFEDVDERDRFFEKIVRELEDENKARFKRLQENKRPFWRQVTTEVRDKLYELGFVEVRTPEIIPVSLLEKMEVSDDLRRQVYWLEDENRCLRPMLAPNLYSELRHFRRISDSDVVRIFEVGTCFRKEKSTSEHLNEFTMLNAVEMGEIQDTEERLYILIEELFSDKTEYETIEEESTLYGKTVDVLVDGMEVASCIAGPHPLDRNWSIDEPWVGIGMGMERLAMILDEGSTAKAYGNTFIYEDGVRLDIK
ncbi:pyrrolysine--tRNA(Pyl) ligase large subunit [Methanonatronarchaeum sp. AMET6-2]|uniref:pyrrolysine--tRNA(Pyl) ligase large subunit n=1 Tax=Methanonatronarchaeum sp. AMET6-2 TaxID=2933293 RepID=UPI00122605B2|nr:pyrrolysine--tRNA(Pyl) ligase large subunit [Methanonatronarchaeum sp. AMET6-2]RZN62326.1 MAG: pyrrolysine--tRNA(Pyl) ligase large subunit [Methanonatronarchaeia archaeon]UOY09577.1 pyrrolysine--tRNA(Pyl) ligase large subunit [Methanonatronarchaeum sp. AMET6-2]